MVAQHVHHEYYMSLPDFDSRLKTSILGRPDAGVEFPHITDRFAPYLDWLNHPEVLTIHFEDLIHERAATLSRTVDHLLIRVPLPTPRQLILDSLEPSINPSRSPTFRSGKTGEWRRYFTKEHRKIFKDVAGDLLMRLEYESSNDW